MSTPGSGVAVGGGVSVGVEVGVAVAGSVAVLVGVGVGDPPPRHSGMVNTPTCVFHWLLESTG